MQTFSKMTQSSPLKATNAKETQNNSDQSRTYKFCVYPGNNTLLKRNVWTQAGIDNLLAASLIWKPLNYPSTLYGDIEELVRYHADRNILMNHFEHNCLITHKSALVKSLRRYYSHQAHIYSQNYHVFETIPTTFIVKPHTNDSSDQWGTFRTHFQQLQNGNFSKQKMPIKHCSQNIWYVKPEEGNQGRGIFLSKNLKQIESHIFSKAGSPKWVIQKAIQKPLLYNQRKFDIRAWLLVTSDLQVYFYTIPYIRTASISYQLKELDIQIHLTNNSQQKNSQNYSKYEQGNTLPFQKSLQIILKSQPYNYEESQTFNIIDSILKRMKELSLDAILSVKKMYSRHGQKKIEFQLYGLDFILDEDFRVWLIQVNNNPYLGTPNNFIKKLIPEMLDQMLQIAIDPIFPPLRYNKKDQNKFQLIYNETTQQKNQNCRSASNSIRKKDYYPAISDHAESSLSQSRPHTYRSSVVQIGNLKQKSNPNKRYYSTPSETIKYLLDTYCFSDYDPFFIPSSLILTTPRMEDPSSLDSNLKNLRLITQTRIAPILLQNKFIIPQIKLLTSDRVSRQIKSTLIKGYTKIASGKKKKIILISELLPHILSLNNQDLKPNLAVEILLLMLKLSGNINRKIFIPGESRQKESFRQYFIRSNCLNIMLDLIAKNPGILTQEVDAKLSTYQEKDWKLNKKVKDQLGEDCLEIVKPLVQKDSPCKTSLQAAHRSKMQILSSVELKYKSKHSSRKRKSSFKGQHPTASQLLTSNHRINLIKNSFSPVKIQKTSLDKQENSTVLPQIRNVRDKKLSVSIWK